MHDKCILIAYPSPDLVHADFCHDLQMLTLKSVAVHRLWIAVTQQRGSLLCITRNNLVDVINTSGIDPSHILFLDTDMRFPADTLHILLQHNLPAVGATYCMRKPPHAMTHRNLDGSSHTNWNPSEFTLTGAVQVASMGFGCLLVQTPVFRRLDELDPDSPYFKVEYTGRKPCGEDVYFFRRLHQAQIPAYLDPALSRRVRHVGTYEYSEADVTKVYDGSERTFEYTTELQREAI